MNNVHLRIQSYSDFLYKTSGKPPKIKIGVFNDV